MEIEIKKTPHIENKKYCINRSEILSRYLGGQILYFTDVLKENFSDKELKNMFNNLNDLVVEDYYEQDDNLAKYMLRNNKILIHYYDNELQSFHELFHMSSTIVTNNRIFSGFYQLDNNYEIGKALNEGYTEYITKKYFGDFREIKKSTSYNYFVKVAKCLEYIIGKEMESLYLKANLYGLNQRVKKLINSNTFVIFLQTLDSLHNYLYDKQEINDEDILNISDSAKFINFYLISLFKLKLLNERRNEIKKTLEINSFYKKLPRHIIANNEYIPCIIKKIG